MWENLKNIILKHKFPLMIISYIIIIFTLMTKGILMPNLLGSLILIGGLFGILTFNLLKFISNKNMALFMIGVLVVLTLLILLLLFLANSTTLILTFNKLLTVFSVIINQYYGNKGIFPIDSFHFFDSGYRILNGEVPFLDYWVVKGPLLDYLQAGFFYIFGENWQAYVFHASFFYD